jgi:hypothetical protein
MASTPLFDRELLEARRRRARRIGPATFLMDRAAEDFADRLAAVLRRFDRAADLGTPTGAVRAALAGNGAIGTMIAVDPACEGDAAGEGALRVVADVEALPFAGGALDLVFPLSNRERPTQLIQICHALDRTGFLAAMLLAPR